MPSSPRNQTHPTRLAREMGLMGLVATGICSMVGAGINVIPFMIQRQRARTSGRNVLPGVHCIAAVPAVLAGLSYATLASAMPRAGGSYVYASRALSAYLGFIASFSQWFSLCVAIGVVSYVLVPFLRDIAVAVEWTVQVAALLETGPVRLTISHRLPVDGGGGQPARRQGLRAAHRAADVPHLRARRRGHRRRVLVHARRLQRGPCAPRHRGAARGVVPPLTLSVLMPASALLFASFIGFDSIAQAGGEARRPGRDLPLAIVIAVASVGLFYSAVHGGRLSRRAMGVRRRAKPAGATSPLRACSASCCRRSGPSSSCRVRRWRSSRICRRCCWRCRV